MQGNNPSEIEMLFEELERRKTPVSAHDLGRALVMLEVKMDVKKAHFARFFALVENIPGLEAIANLWACGAMLQDDMPEAPRIMAVRGLFDDPEVDADMIDSWVKVVWTAPGIGSDMLHFLAMDIRQRYASTLSAEALELLG